MKVHYPKLYPLLFKCFTASKGSNTYILFAITAAGVVPSGGPKKSPRTSSIVQIKFFFCSFEISEDIWSISNILYVKNHHLNRFLNNWPLWEYKSFIKIILVKILEIAAVMNVWLSLPVL